MSRRIKTAGFLADVFLYSRASSWPSYRSFYLLGGMLLGCGFFWRLFLAAGFLATFFLGIFPVTWPRRKLPDAPVPLDYFKLVFFTPVRRAKSVEVWLISHQGLEVFMMYFNMSWRGEPPLSFKLEMACLNISLYFWWGAGLCGFAAAFFFDYLAGAGAADRMIIIFCKSFESFTESG